MTLEVPQLMYKSPIVLGTHLPSTYQYVSPMENTVKDQGKSTIQDSLSWKGVESLSEVGSV